MLDLPHRHVQRYFLSSQKASLVMVLFASGDGGDSATLLACTSASLGLVGGSWPRCVQETLGFFVIFVL